MTIFFARFWIANLGNWSLVISGVFLHALSIGLIIDAAVRTLLIVRINYASPVVTIQRYLACCAAGRSVRSSGPGSRSGSPHRHC